MSFLSIFENAVGITAAIDRNTHALERIAACFERVAPPIPLPPEPSQRSATDPPDSSDGFHLSESPEEYQSRTDREAALALSLGVAPWSPPFQRALAEMREDIAKAGLTDAQGNRREYTEDELDDAIRQAFQVAKAQANTLTGVES